MRDLFRHSLALWRNWLVPSALIYAQVIAVLCVFSHVILWAMTHAVVWVPACDDSVLSRGWSRVESLVLRRAPPSCGDEAADPFDVPGASWRDAS